MEDGDWRAAGGASVPSQQEAGPQRGSGGGVPTQGPHAGPPLLSQAPLPPLPSRVHLTEAPRDPLPPSPIGLLGAPTPAPTPGSGFLPLHPTCSSGAEPPPGSSPPAPHPAISLGTSASTWTARPSPASGFPTSPLQGPPPLSPGGHHPELPARRVSWTRAPGSAAHPSLCSQPGQPHPPSCHAAPTPGRDRLLWAVSLCPPNSHAEAPVAE